MQALEIQGIKMQALLIAMHLFFDLWNSECFMFQKLLSLFCFHRKLFLPQISAQFSVDHNEKCVLRLL